MEFICDRDYDYIKNKYHDTSKPFDRLQRFIRHDAIFDEASGLDGEVIKEMILSQDATLTHLSHPERKAHALRLVLENTRIDCDRRDIFPAINCVDRPLDATVIKLWKDEVFNGIIPEVEAKRALFEKEGIVTIWADYCHSVPVFERLLSLGFKGLMEDCERARYASPNTQEEEQFFEGIKLTYEAIIAFIKRLAKRAQSTEGSEMMARALSNIAEKAPDSFYEACLAVYIYFMISEHVDGLQVRSLSNFDRIYYPYWVRDLERGVSEDELKRQLAYYLMQFAAIDNYWGQPIFLGGTKADGSTEINPLSYIFLDVYDKMGIFNPKIQLKVSYKNTPHDFLKKALDMIRRGNNSIVFVCEETIVRAMMNHGATYEEARGCNIHGCYEYSPSGSFGCGMNYLNLMKPLEYALHRGKDGVSHRPAGLVCRPVSEYSTFEELYAEYKRQLKYVVDETVNIVNSFEDYLYVIDPLSQLAATFPSAIASKKDPVGGGALDDIGNSSAIMAGFLADIADSLAMIKKYVYDRKEISLTELVAALDSDFAGNEALRKKLLLDPDKYGNNMDLPDGIAVEITEYLKSIVHGRNNCAVRGGKWKLGFHVARQSYTQAPMTASSPNGRLRGEELSKNVSSSMGQNKQGATAAILSATKINSEDICGDLCLDMGLLPSAVSGEDGLTAMLGLLLTFMKRGGHALHINVFNADTLRAAQREPEKYRDLQIRVCGWNVLWNDIVKPEQDGFIRQADSLI